MGKDGHREGGGEPRKDGGSGGDGHWGEVAFSVVHVSHYHQLLR